MRKHTDDDLALYMFAGNNDFHLKFPTKATRNAFYTKIDSLREESQLTPMPSVASMGHQPVSDFEWEEDDNGRARTL